MKTFIIAFSLILAGVAQATSPIPKCDRKIHRQGYWYLEFFGHTSESAIKAVQEKVQHSESVRGGILLPTGLIRMAVRGVPDDPSTLLPTYEKARAELAGIVSSVGGIHVRCVTALEPKPPSIPIE